MLLQLENHSFEDGKSKKLHELRSGPNEVTKKLINVIYEIESVSYKNVKMVAYRNHLIAYFPIENAISELVLDFDLRNEQIQQFYRNLMNKKIDKLNKQVDLFTEYEIVSVDNFTNRSDNVQNKNQHEKTLEDNNTTVTRFRKPDWGRCFNFIL